MTDSDNHGRAVRTALVACAIALAVGWGWGPAGAQTDGASELEDLRDRQALLADELDALLATDAEVTAALDELDEHLALQRGRVDAAAEVAAVAAEALVVARARSAAASDEVELLEAAIIDMAVSAFVRPPSTDLVEGLRAGTLNEAMVQKTYLDVRADRDFTLLGELERAEQRASLRTRDVASAAENADGAVARAEDELRLLRGDRRVQRDFADRVHQRIDAALAESAVLADLDARVSARIAREQAALIARLPPVTTTVPPSTVPTTTVATITSTTPQPTATTADTSTSSTSTSSTSTSSPPRTSTTSTTIPEGSSPDDPGPDDPGPDDPGPDDPGPDDPGPDDPAPRRTATPRPPLRTVRGFQVHADIADDIEALLARASEAGFDLGGGAYRSTERQIELREAHCGPTDYDIWEKPASHCRPPTAVPGRSMHEHGRALDFTSGGRLITSRSNPAWVWLSENASAYGLRNLPSEPWHWSTTGG